MSQSDERGLISAARTMAQTAGEGVIASAIAWIADVQISYSSAITLSLAPRTATFAVPQSLINDRVYVHRRGKPTLAGVNVLAGIMVEGTGLVSPAGTVEVYHVIPAVGVGQTLLIPLRLVGYRAAA